jgi:hypothetical protein
MEERIMKKMIVLVISILMVLLGWGIASAKIAILPSLSSEPSEYSIKELNDEFVPKIEEFLEEFGFLKQKIIKRPGDYFWLMWEAARKGEVSTNLRKDFLNYSIGRYRAGDFYVKDPFKLRNLKTIFGIHQIFNDGVIIHVSYRSANDILADYGINTGPILPDCFVKGKGYARIRVCVVTIVPVKRVPQSYGPIYKVSKRPHPWIIENESVQSLILIDPERYGRSSKPVDLVRPIDEIWLILSNFSRSLALGDDINQLMKRWIYEGKLPPRPKKPE